jgi:hypothetical protein
MWNERTTGFTSFLGEGLSAFSMGITVTEGSISYFPKNLNATHVNHTYDLRTS